MKQIIKKIAKRLGLIEYVYIPEYKSGLNPNRIIKISANEVLSDYEAATAKFNLTERIKEKVKHQILQRVAEEIEIIEESSAYPMDGRSFRGQILIYKK